MPTTRSAPATVHAGYQEWGYLSDGTPSTGADGATPNMLVIKIVLLVVSATAFGGGLYGMLSDIRLRGPWGHRLWEVADYVLFFGVVGLLVSIAWLG